MAKEFEGYFSRQKKTTPIFLIEIIEITPTNQTMKRFSFASAILATSIRL